MPLKQCVCFWMVGFVGLCVCVELSPQYLCTGYVCVCVCLLVYISYLVKDQAFWLVCSDLICLLLPCTHTHTHTHTQCNNMSHSDISIWAFMLSSSLIVCCMTSVYVCTCVCVCVCVCLCSNLASTQWPMWVLIWYAKDRRKKRSVREGGEGGDKESYWSMR